MRNRQSGHPKPSVCSPNTSELNAAVSECLLDQLARLPEDYRQAVLLVDMEGLSQKETGERVGLVCFWHEVPSSTGASDAEGEFVFDLPC
jgi:DNA-directed RNA polymerase specialized sigma subunit